MKIALKIVAAVIALVLVAVLALVVVPLGGALILIRLLLQAASTVMALLRPLPQEAAQ